MVKKYIGNVKDVFEASVLVEASTRSIIETLKSRPEFKDRDKIYKGTTIIFNETITGISRWVDGKIWSSSRFKNGFFLYREMIKKEDSSTHYTGLCKKAISIIAPNGHNFHLINYYSEESANLPGVLEHFNNLPQKNDIFKQAEHYSYFKCFRSRSDTWRKPCKAPVVRMQSLSTFKLDFGYKKTQSPLTYAKTPHRSSTVFYLPPMKCKELFDYTQISSLTEDQKQISLLSRYMFI